MAAAVASASSGAKEWPESQFSTDEEGRKWRLCACAAIFNTQVAGNSRLEPVFLKCFF